MFYVRKICPILTLVKEVPNLYYGYYKCFILQPFRIIYTYIYMYTETITYHDMSTQPRKKTINEQYIFMSFFVHHLATQYKLNRKTNINLVIYGQFRILFYISFLSRGLIHVISLLHQTFHIKLVGDSQFLHMDGLLQDLNENQTGQLQMQLITHKYVMLTGNHFSPIDLVIH